MAIADITKPIALDETLQATNTALGVQNGKIDNVATAISSIALSSVGNVGALTTTDKTSLVGAVNELNAGKVNNSEVGVAGGVAELDNTGKVPASQLPAFVDDVIEGYLYNGSFYEDSAHTQLITPEDGKIYIDLVSNKTYRWSGSQYTVISDTLALGETSTTAYRGDRGKVAYDHSQDASRVTSAVAEGLYKVGATAQGHISSMSAVQKSDITALGIPGQDTTYNDATQSVHGLMSASDKTKLDGISTGANKVEDSSTNGNIKIDNVETQVYDDSDIQGKISTTLTPISGNPISISGLKSTQLAVEPVITFEPIQDLHGQSKPYPGGGGKNLYGDENISGTTYFTQTLTKTLPAGTYVISAVITSSDTDANVCLIYDTTNNVSLGTIARSNARTSMPFTLSAPCSSLTFYASISYQASTGDTFSLTNIQIESGSTATPYAPYENICPISGYDKIEVLSCGKNLFDINNVYTGNSIFSINGNTLSKISSSYNTDLYSGRGGQSQSSDKKLFLKAGTYVISYTSTATEKRIWIDGIDATTLVPNGTINKTLASGTSFTVPSAMWVCLKILTAEAATWSNIQIEEATTPTAYSPYHKTTDLSENLPQTVYGGSLDVRTGKFTVTHKIVDLGDLTYTYNAGGLGEFATLLSDSKASASSTCNPNAYCSIYNVRSGGYRTADNYTIGVFDKSYSNDGYFVIRDNRYTSASDLKTALTGQKLVYELATPIEIQLTPTELTLLKDYAYVSTNGTRIDLDYRNGEMASLGDVESASERLDAKIDNEVAVLTKNNAGTEVNLAEYNSESNKYTLGSDGYISLSGNANTTGYMTAHIYGSDSNLIISYVMPITMANQRQSIYVRKGMKCYVISSASGTNRSFIPLK